MKKIFRHFVACAMATLCGLSCISLAACDNGSETVYNVIGTDETYVPEEVPMSGAEIDADIAVDGNFDESFYDNLQWLTLNKVDGTQTATVVMTVRIAQTGLLIAADVVENTLITYNATRPTAYESGIEFYLAFGDGVTWRDGLYEIDITAGERFNIRQYTASGYVDYPVAYDTSPSYAVIRDGSLMDGECTGYRFELFLPYALFDREGRCNEVYVNPTHIAMPDWELTEVRNWYQFGARQSSLYGWDKLNQGFTFDRNGAVINSLAIESAEGGMVTEEFGYDYCITGDTVNLNIKADEGYKLVSLMVNGRECVSDVVADTYSFTAQGDTTVVPVFEVEEGPDIVVSDVYAWIDYPASEFTLELNNGESDYTLEYDTTKLTIDEKAKTVKALAEGTFEVKVTSGSDEASFNVICSRVDRTGTGKWDSTGYADKANNVKSRYASDGTNGTTTVFLGDSFFDNTEGNWSDFYTSYANEYDALELGIGGSTTYDWENFLSGGILDGMQPKNLVVNLGTNNLAADGDTVEGLAENLQRLFTLLHNKMPNTNIYYFSIAQRVDTTAYATKISAVNALMEQWCEYKDWITFVDVEDQVASSDLKDGLHPKDETYANIYVPALEEAGCVVERK